MTNESWDLSTDQGVLRYGEDLKANLRRILQKNGQLGMGVILIATRFKGEVFDAPQPVPIVDTGAYDRDQLTALFRHCIRDCRSLGVFMYSESWHLEFESNEEVELWRHRDWGEHPRAIEALTLTFEHHRLPQRLWRARITRDTRRPISVGEFELVANGFDGRFGDLLTQPVAPRAADWQVHSLVQALLNRDLLAANRALGDAHAANVFWEHVPCPDLDAKGLARAASILELLAERGRARPPAWTASVGALPEPLVLDPWLALIAQSPEQALARTPEALRKRNLIAPPDFLIARWQRG